MDTKKDVTSIIFSCTDHLDQDQKRKSKWQNILQLNYINAISQYALGSITESNCQCVFIWRGEGCAQPKKNSEESTKCCIFHHYKFREQVKRSRVPSWKSQSSTIETHQARAQVTKCFTFHWMRSVPESIYFLNKFKKQIKKNTLSTRQVVQNGTPCES